MTEEKALAEIHAIPRFQGDTPSLAPMRALMHALGDVQESLRFIHIAGTNGKGSTATMIASVLEEEGLRVGLYTSPYINHFRERFRINGTPVDPLTFCRAAKRVLSLYKKLPLREGLSQFDVVSAIGFLLFYEAECDIVVLECGLGGRLDATNVIPPPEVAVITNIGYDHTEILGDHITKISAEKCGILKNGCRCAVFSPQSYPEALSVMEDTAKERGIPFTAVRLSDISLCGGGFATLDFTYRARPWRTHLAAPYQAKNAATAIEVIAALNRQGYAIKEESLRAGLLRASIPARLELVSISPTVLLDGAHNRDGLLALQNSMEILSLQYERLFCLLGMLRDKDPHAALSAFFDSEILRERLVSVATFAPNSPRAASPEELGQALREILPASVEVTPYESSKEALAAILSVMREGDVLLAFGSLYSMGELRKEASLLTDVMGRK